MVLLTSACAKGGGDSSSTSGTAPAAPIPATCKTIYNVWQSDTDQEQHDFSAMANEVVVTDYSYIASDGSACGYANNSNYDLNTQLFAIAPGTIIYDHHVEMHAGLSMGGTCGVYNHAGAEVYQRYSSIFIKELGCNQIELCNETDVCKTFH